MRSMLSTGENSSRSAIMLAVLVAFVGPHVLLLAGHALAGPQSQTKPSNQPVIERIEIIGPRRVQTSTIRARLSSTPGHPFNAEEVQRDVQGLRDTGFFDEVRSKVEDSPEDPNGRILIFYLNERPIIRRIEYKGIRSITEQDLLRACEEKKIGLAVKTYFDQAQLTRVADVIKELLAAHGHASATVKPAYERTASTNMVDIVFNVDEGPKRTN